MDNEQRAQTPPPGDTPAPDDHTDPTPQPPTDNEDQDGGAEAYPGQGVAVSDARDAVEAARQQAPASTSEDASQNETPAV